MTRVRFLTNNGMPAAAISKAASTLVELFDPSNHMGRAERALAMISSGVAVTSSWCPILKQWKCSGAGNPIVLLTCRATEDFSFSPNLNKEEIVSMAVAGIKYVQANLARLGRDQFIEVRLCRGATTTTQLLHVHYPRTRLVHLGARVPHWVQRRSADNTDSELRYRLLFPRGRTDVHRYLVGENGALTLAR